MSKRMIKSVYCNEEYANAVGRALYNLFEDIDAENPEWGFDVDESWEELDPEESVVLYFCGARTADRDANIDEVKEVIELQGLPSSVVEEVDNGCYHIPLTREHQQLLERVKSLEFTIHGITISIAMP